MKPLGIASVKIGKEINNRKIKAEEATPVTFTFTRPLENHETVKIKCHVYEEKFVLNRTIGIFTLSMKQKEESSWSILTDPPSCESEPIEVTIPEELAGATVNLIFSKQQDPTASSDLMNPDLLSQRIAVDILSSESGPKITEVYWCDSKEIKYGQLSVPRTAALTKNETVYLHIHTRGLYGQCIEGIFDSGKTSTIEIRNNIAVETYTFFDDTLNEITVSCRQIKKQFEKTASIPYNTEAIAHSSLNLWKVYAYPGEKRKDHYASEACCRVDFRPISSYNGDFGFSWYRIGDISFYSLAHMYPYPRTTQTIFANHCNDNPFNENDFPGEGIMGKHYETIEETIPQTNQKVKKDRVVKNGNNSGTGCPDIKYENIDGKSVGRDNFIPDVTMAEGHKNDYVKICMDRYRGIPHMEQYPVPAMTIRHGETVELQLLLRVNKSPKIILFEFDNPNVETRGFISFNVKETPIVDPPRSPVDMPDINYTISLTCHKVFDKELRLKAYAIPRIESDESKIMAHKENGKIVMESINGYPLVPKELCGMLRILPNDDAHWRTIDVVFFNVKTLADGNKEKFGIAKGSTKETDDLNKYLAQAYVKARITEEEIDLVTNSADQSNYLNCCMEITENGTKIKIIDHSKRRDLISLLDGKIPNTYRGSGYYRIFFMPEKGSDNKGGFYSPNNDFAVCYANTIDTTPVHEILHSLGLPHTFNGNEDKGASYTYEDGKTDNIMDYSSIRNSLFEWQWHAINTNLKK